jgi:hypothetical protein
MEFFGGIFGETKIVTKTMAITASKIIKGMPHFATEDYMSRYHPVNGWVIPDTINIEVDDGFNDEADLTDLTEVN